MVHLRWSTMLLLSIATAALGAPRLEIMDPARTSIYLGESLNFDVRVHDWSQEVGEPDTSAIRDAGLRLLGSQSISQQFIQIINGRREERGFSGRVFTFSLTPTKTGSITLGPISITVDGKPQTQQGPTISVTPVESQDFVKLKLLSSRESVLVDEPFTITFQMDIKALPGEFDRRPPVHHNRPPNLKIPYLDIDPDSIKDLEIPSAESVLQPMITSDREPGFIINEYTLRRDIFSFGFDGLDRKRYARFAPDHQIVEVDGQPYHRYTIALTYTPKAEGSHTFGPVEFRGDIISGVENNAYAKLKKIFAIGSAVTVRVTAPPEEGRPASFTGGVGKALHVDSMLDTETCSVGDPLTLTVEVTGDISLQNLRPPRLSVFTNITDSFRVYDDSVSTRPIDGGRRYTYRIRPIESGTLELPPIQVSYYNTEERRYITAASDPIPVRANEGQLVSENMIIGPDTNSLQTGSATLGAEEARNAFAITVSPLGAKPRAALLTRRVWPAVLAMPLACMLVWASRLLTSLLPGVRRKRRHAQAFPLCRSAIKKATHLAESDTDAACSELVDALRTYVSYAFDTDASAATPADIAAAFGSGHDIPEAAREIGRLLEPHFNRGFSAGAGAPNVAKDAERILELLRGLRQQRTTTSAGKAAIMIFLTAIPLAFGARIQDREFAWNEANARMGSAQSPDDFRQAAQIYYRVEQLGGDRPELFWNVGVALFEAGQYPEAIRYFQRAERFRGSDVDIRAALLACERGIQDGENSAPVQLPWYRIPLFWHYSLPLRQRFWFSIIAFNVLFLGLLLRLLQLHSPAKVLVVAGLAGLIIFGASAAASVVQEQSDATTTLLLQPTPTTAKTAN